MIRKTMSHKRKVKYTECNKCFQVQTRKEVSARMHEYKLTVGKRNLYGLILVHGD